MRFAEIQQHSFQAFKMMLVSVVVFVPVVRAQESPVQQLNAPPPLKIISQEDRAQLDGANDANARVRMTLELARNYLTRAEDRTAQHEYDGAASELGRYIALIEDALSFVSPMNPDRNKTRDLYKRLELALRAHGPRLTAMRRTTPLEYAVWIKELEDFARKGRSEALNSFYGHTVVREGQQKPAGEKRSKKQSKDAATAPEINPQ